ncbi:MAG: hypothetical protein ACJ75H_11225 [Thermoanaerobaculia bacterium]
MAKDLKAKKYEIDVLFDAALAAAGLDPFSYKGDIEGKGKDFQLLIDQNLGWIDLHLKTQNAKDDAAAVFSTGVIQWLSPQGTPDPTPVSFAVQRSADDLATLVNINRVELKGSQVTFNFEIGVVYRGKTFTSPDPTIINVDPTGGGGFLLEEPVPVAVSAVS